MSEEQEMGSSQEAVVASQDGAVAPAAALGQWFSDATDEVCAVLEGGAVVVIAVVNPLAELTPEVAAAHGRLIAAAPELLVALREAEHLRDQLCGMISKAHADAQDGDQRPLLDLAADLDCWMHNGMFASYRDTFEDAIAKATGAGK